jgi:hypothetical protein
MSALVPTADIDRNFVDVGSGPEGDIFGAIIAKSASRWCNTHSFQFERLDNPHH